MPNTRLSAQDLMQPKFEYKTEGKTIESHPIEESEWRAVKELIEKNSAQVISNFTISPSTPSGIHHFFEVINGTPYAVNTQKSTSEIAYFAYGSLKRVALGLTREGKTVVIKYTPTVYFKANPDKFINLKKTADEFLENMTRVKKKLNQSFSYKYKTYQPMFILDTHPNLGEALEIYEDLVEIEDYKGPDLYEYFVLNSKNFDLEQKLIIAMHCALNLYQTLHVREILRDYKPENLCIVASPSNPYSFVTSHIDVDYSEELLTYRAGESWYQRLSPWPMMRMPFERGTKHVLSPEAASNENDDIIISPASDIYSLMFMLIEDFCLAANFRNESDLEFLYRGLDDEPTVRPSCLEILNFLWNKLIIENSSHITNDYMQQIRSDLMVFNLVKTFENVLKNTRAQKTLFSYRLATPDPAMDMLANITKIYKNTFTLTDEAAGIDGNRQFINMAFQLLDQYPHSSVLTSISAEISDDLMKNLGVPVRENNKFRSWMTTLNATQELAENYTKQHKPRR